MRHVSDRRTRSPAAGSGAESGLQRPTIKVQDRPTSSVRSARSSARRRRWSCVVRDIRDDPCIWPKSLTMSPITRTPSSSWIRRAVTCPTISSFPATLPAAAAEIAGIEPGRKSLALHARELALKPRLQIIPGHRQPLLRCLAKARKPTLTRHLHRTKRMGQ